MKYRLLSFFSNSPTQPEIEQKRIAILGLNSAWLSSSKEDRCHLILGEREVRTALEKSERYQFSHCYYASSLRLAQRF